MLYTSNLKVEIQEPSSRSRACHATGGMGCRAGFSLFFLQKLHSKQNYEDSGYVLFILISLHPQCLEWYIIHSKHVINVG